MTTALDYQHGTPLTVSWLNPGGPLHAYALGPIRSGVLHYVLVDSIDGSVSTYRANDQNGFPAIDETGTVWDMPRGMIQALFQTSVREHANAEAENTRYRELVTAREELATVRATSPSREVMRAEIMREMMERAAEIADNEGFCGEYDRLAEALGYEGRERDFDVNVEIESFTVSVRVRATSADIACDSVDESEVDDAIRDYLRNNSVSWSTDGAERA